MIGRTVGPYELVDRLGAGGMGEVYAARDTRLDRPAALKALSSELTSDPNAVARFEWEAKAVAAMNHPNIVTVYSVEEDEGTVFLAMELVEGRTLTESITRHGLPAERIFEIGVPLADAVAAAHERGIVHRDLKPGNVMVTPEGRIKVLDFGLAKLRRDSGEEADTLAPTGTAPLTREGTTLGTLPYMAPEQVRGETADERSDVFALGVVLYEMATGRRPFPGESRLEVSREILSYRPPPVDQVRPELPRHLARIVTRCLEKDPRRRYQSAADLRNDLDDLARELDRRSLAPQRSVDRPRSGPGRSRLLLGLAALAGLGLVVALGLLITTRNGPTTDGGDMAVATPGSDRADGRAVEAGGQPEIRALAVLPFDNLMNDPEQDYFVEGMHEALITDLARIGELRVISRTSAMRYRETTKSIPEIARELDVDALIEGSVLRAGDSVRITAQLIDGETDEHLWADSYDRELRDVLALLSEVARDIAGEIELAVVDPGDLGPAPRVDPDVYELILRAQHAFKSFSEDGYRRSLELAREALELDPEYAPAKAQLASAWLLLGAFGHEPVEEAAPKAKAAALEALALDDTLAGAHNALGWVEMYFEWDWHPAERRFRRALELDPNNPYARHGLGDYLCAVGRVDEGLEQVELGYQYDPFSPITFGPLVAHLVLARHYEEAVARGREGVELFGRRGDRWNLAKALWQLGRHREAVEHWKALIPEAEAPELESVFGRDGADAALRWMAERTVAKAEVDTDGPYSAAAMLAWIGEVDRAFEWLHRAYDERSHILFQFRVDPRFDSLRGDPRRRELLERMGLGDGELLSPSRQ